MWIIKNSKNDACMDVKFIFDRAEADKMRRDWERVDRSRTKASEIIIIKKGMENRIVYFS